MSDSQEYPSICIVAHNAYGVLANVDTGHAGGIEVQTPLMAKWLAAQGFKVSLITWDEGYEDGVVIDGVKVFKLCKKSEGVKMVRFLYPRWHSLIAALNRADADIVYYNCVDLGLGQVVLWAKKNKRKVMFSSPNDSGCVRSLPTLGPLRERVLYRYGLFRADDIVVQTEIQQSLLLKEFNLKSSLIRMPSEGFSSNGNPNVTYEEGSERHVLWVGRIAEVKRIEWLLDVAERRPEIIFDVVGDSNDDSSYAKSQFERAQSLKNVNMHGRVPHFKMGEFYSRAFLLCSTSTMEGFPNVYLEAWSVGLPLVTTFDPDGVVNKYGQGLVADSIESLIEAIDTLSNAASWKKASSAAISYFQTYHTVDSCMSHFAERFITMKE